MTNIKGRFGLINKNRQFCPSGLKMAWAVKWQRYSVSFLSFVMWITLPKPFGNGLPRLARCAI